MIPIEQFSLLKHYETITSTNTNAMETNLKFNINGKDYSFDEFVRVFPEWNITIEREPNPARDEYFEQLYALIIRFIDIEDEEQEKRTKERILSITYDKVEELMKRVQELEHFLESEREYRKSNHPF